MWFRCHNCRFHFLSHLLLFFLMSLSPNLIQKCKGKMCTVFLISFEIWSINNIVEKYANLKCNFIDFRQVLKSHLRSFFKLSKNGCIMMICMVKSPILTEIFYHNVPPFSTDEMIFLFFCSSNRVDSFNHFHPNILIFCEFLNGKSILCQNMGSDLCWRDFVFDFLYWS